MLRVIRRVVPMALVLFSVATTMSAAGVPSVVKDRFVVGDPVWKELTIRDELGQNYDKCWNSLVEIIIDKGYEIGFMEKESGYVRTNENMGVVRLKNNWVYDVKIIAKLVLSDQGLTEGKKTVKKLRVQVQGALYKKKDGNLVESHLGYDKQVLQDMFNDLQLVFGNQ